MNPTLAANLEALAKRHPALATSLGRAKEPQPLHLQVARSGHSVPFIPHAERLLALHSLFDPEREAHRLKRALIGSSTPAEGAPFLYFEGLGAGFQVSAFLREGELSGGVIVEHDLELFGALLSTVDLSEVLSAPRIGLLLDPSPEELSAHLRVAYLPGVMGGFVTVPLRPRVQASNGYFEGLRPAVRRALEEISADFSVQANFGRLWTRNIALNLPRISPAACPQPDEVLVAAAGPSLEAQRDRLRSLRRGRFLIAADTALPTLLLWGEPPDAVLSIDAQAISYRHFLRGLPSRTISFLELAAPPTLFRYSRRPVAVAGGHPLSLLAARHIGGMPIIDTSGGNVGHAAVSLALELGASRVYLFGADFSYPAGKSYARGTHLYDYFSEHETRSTPLESGMFGLVLRNPPLSRVDHNDVSVYSTQNLDAYRERFERSFAPYRRRLTIAEGDGIPILFPEVPTLTPRYEPRDSFSHRDLRRFLLDYTAALQALSPRIPVGSSASSAEPFSEWELFATLYPLVARLRKEHRKPVSAEAIYADAIRMALLFFERAGDI